VAASVMTPIPLTIVYIIIKLRKCLNKSTKAKLKSEILAEDLLNDRSNSNKTSSSTLPITDDNQSYSYDKLNWSNGKV